MWTEQKSKQFLVLILEDFRASATLLFKCLILGSAREILLPALSENCHLLQDLEPLSQVPASTKKMMKIREKKEKCGFG